MVTPRDDRLGALIHLAPREGPGWPSVVRGLSYEDRLFGLSILRAYIIAWNAAALRLLGKPVPGDKDYTEDPDRRG